MAMHTIIVRVNLGSFTKPLARSHMRTSTNKRKRSKKYTNMEEILKTKKEVDSHFGIALKMPIVACYHQLLLIDDWLVFVGEAVLMVLWRFKL